MGVKVQVRLYSMFQASLGYKKSVGVWGYLRRKKVYHQS